MSTTHGNNFMSFFFYLTLHHEFSPSHQKFSQCAKLVTQGYGPWGILISSLPAYMLIEEKVTRVSIPDKGVLKRKQETQSIISIGMSGKQTNKQKNQKTSTPNTREYRLNQLRIFKSIDIYWNNGIQREGDSYKQNDYLIYHSN